MSNDSRTPAVWGPILWNQLWNFNNSVDFDGDDETLSKAKKSQRHIVVFVKQTKSNKKSKLGQLGVFTYLPDDVWLNIIKFQSDADKKKLSMVSHRFCEIYEQFKKMHPLVWELDMQNHDPWNRFSTIDDWSYYRLPKWTFGQISPFYARVFVEVITKSETSETDFSLGSFIKVPTLCTLKLKECQNCHNYLPHYDHLLRVAYADGCVESDFNRYKTKGKNATTKVIKYHESVDQDEKLKHLKHNRKNKQPEYKQMKSKPNKFNRNYR